MAEHAGNGADDTIAGADLVESARENLLTAGQNTAGHELDRWMTVSDAAAELGIAPATVKTLALKKELESELSAGRIVIGRESVRRYKNAHLGSDPESAR